MAIEDAAVSPDAGVLIDLGTESPPLELLLELARDERPVRLADRLRRYDGHLSLGWRSVPRFQHAGRPAVVFIAHGYRDVDRLLRAADAASGAPARSPLIFCAEPDLHRGDLRAWMLPRQTPQKARLDGLHGDRDHAARLSSGLSASGAHRVSWDARLPRRAALSLGVPRSRPGAGS